VKKLVCFLLIAGLTGTALWAQDTSAAQNGAPTLSPPLSAKMRIAMELYVLMGGAKTAEDAANAVVASLEQDPTMVPYKDVLKKWIGAVFYGSDFQEKIAELYAETYTLDELNQLIDLYRSPLGKKMLATLPELTRRSGQIGVQLAKAHLPELEDMMKARQQELKQQSQAGN